VGRQRLRESGVERGLERVEVGVVLGLGFLALGGQRTGQQCQQQHGQEWAQVLSHNYRQRDDCSGRHAGWRGAATLYDIGNVREKSSTIGGEFC
jgi:hypothetical protein